MRLGRRARRPTRRRCGTTRHSSCVTPLSFRPPLCPPGTLLCCSSTGDVTSSPASWAAPVPTVAVQTSASKLGRRSDPPAAQPFPTEQTERSAAAATPHSRAAVLADEGPASRKARQARLVRGPQRDRVPAGAAEARGGTQLRVYTPQGRGGTSVENRRVYERRPGLESVWRMVVFLVSRRRSGTARRRGRRGTGRDDLHRRPAVRDRRRRLDDAVSVERAMPEPFALDARTRTRIR